jgi:hypothetical protein
MNKILSIVLFAGGVVLIIAGISSSNSVASAFSEWINGAPSDKSIWLLIGGVVATALGVSGLLRGTKTF